MDKEFFDQQKKEDEILKKKFEQKLKTLEVIRNPIEVRFFLTGVPPDKAQKIIEVDMDDTIEIVKIRLVDAYKINPPIHPEFIFKGKLLPDKKVLMETGLDPEKDYIRVMITACGISIP